MKTRIEIFGNIKKLALAAVVLLCVNVDGWGQAEHVDYTVKLSLNSIIQSYSGSGTPSSIYNVCVGFEAENYEGQTIWKNQYSSVGSYPYNYSYYCSSCSFELKTGRAANIKSIRAVILAIKVWNSYSSCCDCPTNNEILPYQDYTRAYIVYVDDRVYNGLTYPCTQTITVDYNDDSDTPVHSSGGGNSPIATTFSVDIIPQKPSIIKFVGANNISKPASDMGNYMVNDRGTGLQASYIDVYGGNMQYNWEFKCGNTIKQISTVGSSVGFTGNAVFGVDEFLKMVENKTPIYVKTNLCDLSSDEIILQPKLSSPTVASIEQTPPSCHGASDGKAVIRFSRAVYNKELLQFAVGGVSNTAHTVPPGSDTFTLTGLSAGIDTIIISGKYPYPPNN